LPLKTKYEIKSPIRAKAGSGIGRQEAGLALRSPNATLLHISYITKREEDQQDNATARGVVEKKLHLPRPEYSPESPKHQHRMGHGGSARACLSADKWTHASGEYSVCMLTFASDNETRRVIQAPGERKNEYSVMLLRLRIHHWKKYAAGLRFVLFWELVVWTCPWTLGPKITLATLNLG